MRWTLRVGTLFGIQVELHITFLLFVGWIALTRGLFSGTPGRALTGVVLLLLIFTCVLLHELGHALAARRYGIVTRDIILLPIGGIARLQRMPDKPAQELVVAVMGPAVNVAIAALLTGLMFALRRPFTLESFGGDLVATLLAVNVVMVLFNMIPAFPMDGGRVLRALLAMRLPYVRATQIAAMVGQGFALLFGVVGFFYNPMLMFVALFVFLAAGEEHALVRTRASLSGLPARAAMITEFDTLDVADPLQRAVDRLIGGTQQDFPVLERTRPIGVLSRGDLLLGLQRFGVQASVGEVVTRDGGAAEPGEPLEEVYRRMRELQRSALPVVSDGRLVGLLTLENVTELLLVQDALKRHARSA